MSLCLAVIIGLLVVPALTPPYRIDKVLALGWVIGSAIGSLALIAYFAQLRVTSREILLAGLVVGNVTATATIVVLPISAIAASVPVFSGAVVVAALYRKSAGIAFAGVPFLILLLRLMIGTIVSPQPAWL